MSSQIQVFNHNLEKYPMNRLTSEAEKGLKSLPQRCAYKEEILVISTDTSRPSYHFT